MVANTYTLLTCLTPELTRFKDFDLKHTFFCFLSMRLARTFLHLNGKTPNLDAKLSSCGQFYTKDLRTCPQYLENNLQKIWTLGKLHQGKDSCCNIIAARTQEMCRVQSKPPKLFGFTGVWSIPEASPDGEASSSLLGLRGQCWTKSLGMAWDGKGAICQTPKPQRVKELRTFLGVTVDLQLWAVSPTPVCLDYRRKQKLW